ncbi:MAG: hypothetical protein U0Y10_06325 [Spirosomataceae bacterium]
MKLALQKFAPAALVALPIIGFWYYFGVYSVNAPMWDDFVLTDFILRLSDNPAFSEKIRLFFAQHNAHRIVYDRVVTYLIWVLTGQLDFRMMMLVGNLSLMGLIALCWQLLKGQGLSLWYLVPVPWLLLTIQGYENTFWAMASLQNYTVLLFILGALYCLALCIQQGSSKAFVGAAVLGILATFTSGNGQMTFFIGMLLLVYFRRWGLLLRWVGIMLPTLGLYFWGYKRLPQELFTPKFFINFFAFNGAAFADGDQYRWALVVGVLVFVGLFGIFCWKVGLPLLRLKRVYPALEHTVLYAWFIFLCITSLLVAASHLEELPIHETLVSRYKIYSHLFLIISYLWVVILASNRLKKWFLTAGILGGMVFWISAYYQFFDDMHYRNRDLLVTGFNVHQNGTCLMGISHASAMDSIYQKLEAKQLYRLPNRIVWPSAVSGGEVHLQVQEVERKLLYFTPLVKTLAIANQDLLPTINTPTDGALVVLRSARKAFVFSTHQNRNGKKGFFMGKGYYRSGFFTEIHKPLLPPDTYQVGLLLVENGASRLLMTPQTIVVHSNELVE